MEFGVFNESEALLGYIGQFNLTVSANQTLRWNLEVTNRMGLIQLAQVIYRLGNGSTATPNPRTPSPATVPEIGSTERFIDAGDTARIEFQWNIISKNQTGGMVFLRLVINGEEFSSPVGAVSGRGFRFIFELWTFDLAAKSFQYGWKDESSRRGAWLQVWFDAP